jgi:hypothetical protein
MSAAHRSLLRNTVAGNAAVGRPLWIQGERGRSRGRGGQGLPHRPHAGSGLRLCAEGLEHLRNGGGHHVEAGQLEQDIEHLGAEAYTG